MIITYREIQRLTAIGLADLMFFDVAILEHRGHLVRLLMSPIKGAA